LQPARAELAMRRGDRLVDPWETLRAYESATQLDPGHEQHRFGLARHLQKLAAHATSPDERVALLEQARAACERAIALVPGYGTFHGCRARLLADLARLNRVEPAAALAEFDRALELDPCHAYLLADAANAALTLSQLDKARDYTERGLACYPQFGVLRAHRGYLAMVAKDYDKACAELNAAVEFGNWYGDRAGQEFARRMLEQAVRLRDRVAVEKTAAGPPG
jgi:tetratricopeptide (TPR) repeat protein